MFAKPVLTLGKEGLIGVGHDAYWSNYFRVICTDTMSCELGKFYWIW